MKLILEVNVKAGYEEVVLAKIKEVYKTNLITTIEQLSDYYVMLDFDNNEAEKALQIQKTEGVIDIKLTPIMPVVQVPDSLTFSKSFLVFIDTVRGKEEEVMSFFRKNQSTLFKLRFASYIFDYRGDIVIEISSNESIDKIISAVRGVENIVDTIFYNLCIPPK